MRDIEICKYLLVKLNLCSLVFFLEFVYVIILKRDIYKFWVIVSEIMWFYIYSDSLKLYLFGLFLC